MACSLHSRLRQATLTNHRHDSNTPPVLVPLDDGADTNLMAFDIMVRLLPA
jgi:hypothetical protein